MPITVELREDGGILVTGSGRVTGAELIEVEKQMYKTEAATKNIAYRLCDFTKLENLDISADEMRIVARLDSEASALNPKMLIAVAGDSDVVYGMARMWQAYVDENGDRNQVFRTMESATQWLREQGVLPTG